MFVILLVAVFSLQSGYFMVLINEYAARGLDKVSQTYAAREINLWFQVRVLYIVPRQRTSTDTLVRRSTNLSSSDTVLKITVCLSFFGFYCMSSVRLYVCMSVVYGVSSNSCGIYSVNLPFVCWFSLCRWLALHRFLWA
jgi:hypothetical protein